MKAALKILTGITALFIISCKSNTGAARKNQSLYKQNNINIDVQYVIHHENDSVSRLYYAFPNDELVYKKTGSDSLFTAEIHLFYKLLPAVNSKQFTDTGTVIITDKQASVVKGTIRGSKQLKIAQGSKAWLDLSLRDINRKAYNHSELAINKLSRLGAQNYLLKNTDSTIIYSSYINSGKTITLSNKRIADKQLYIHFASAENMLPPPPFSTKEIQPYHQFFDSTFVLNKTMDNYFVADINKEGIYFITADSNETTGCAVYGVDEDFPKVTSHKQMIESIRYITSKDEYNELISSKNKQEAIENFWIHVGGNRDRAKNLIRKYYTRVQDTNTKFSSYKEGWRTDRGMIYIIFGPPEYVYQSEGHETWTYSNNGIPGALKFDFNRINNRFTDNDYVLERNSFYKDPWYLAVDAWREGRIYLDN